MPEHPAFNEGAAYTRDNFKNDIKNVILSYSPDIIYCVDYDKHPDHRAVSLLFEESMGEILSERNDYHPLVFKGFAYSTSMYAEPDYNQRNIASTQNPYGKSYMEETNIYNWGERVRVPVAASSLSRLFRGTGIYKALIRHRSQTVFKFAQGSANSDKVFWQRETTSLLYDAEFSSDNKKLTFLNDFKLADSSDILDEENSMSGADGVVPADGGITVTLPQKKMMDRIVIYDNPSVKDNVSGVIIRFDDGTTVRCDKIEKNGSGTDISFQDARSEALLSKRQALKERKQALPRLRLLTAKKITDLIL